MATNKLIIGVTADTTEALEGIKEVTEAANECVEALEKLEKVMNRFSNRKVIDETFIGISCKFAAEQMSKTMRGY
ncbi:hypothetical protein [Bacillus cereus]|uniref:hypothetical protein n=1 Tax=Bacillus cereus TaxID=1396 RepID=UPI000BF93B2A|nr:hypothetical protein [Bacillus cereus]PFV45287.1 hypothetical protein COL00_21560 [Bacillus cereus]PGQ00124.1 hypothetical protein COA09_31020 [Bacillus cereus]PGS55988.1 hypothetical protein COC67_21010 [Bacillus cereus]PGU90851.1 hypothetical protein COD77_30080 [Bacillus cereus]